MPRALIPYVTTDYLTLPPSADSQRPCLDHSLDPPAHCSHGVRRRRTRCLRWARRGSAHCCAAEAAETSARLVVRPMPRRADGCIKCAIRQASCSLAARVREAAML